MVNAPQLETQKRLYFDLEKFHRIIGYYEGQKIKPLEVHEKHISGDLEKYFRAPDQYIRRMQFDLFMKNVLFEEKQIFETDKPEATLLYLLFSEGVKSLVLLRDLTASEIKEWCILVRETLIALDSGASKDLASVLWKTPFRNLRTRIYNTLMDLAEQRIADRQKASATAPSSETEPPAPKPKEQPKSGWHNRDAEWDLPSADNIVREIEASKSMDTDEFVRLKTQLEASKSKMDRVSLDILNISDEELELLSSEMSMYDQSQVEFNLLAWNVSVLDGSFGCDPQAEIFIEDLVSLLAKSFVKRFHPGLILHLMNQIEKFHGVRFQTLRDKMKEALSTSLSTKENTRRLLDSLADPSRSVLAKRLLPFVDKDQFPMIVDYYIETKDNESLLYFLETLFAKDLPLEEMLLSWGEERLTGILPLFSRISWSHKYIFLAKAIRSKFPSIVKAASEYILHLQLRHDLAVELFRKLPGDIQEIWIRNFKEKPPSENWKPFIELMARSEFWTKYPLKIRKALVEIFFKYLKEGAFKILYPWVGARRLVLWPKHPEMRELILSVGFDLQGSPLQKIFNEVAVREVKVRFQDENLKERLRRRASLVK